MHDALNLRRTVREQKRARREREAPPPDTEESSSAVATAGSPRQGHTGELADSPRESAQPDRAAAAGVPGQERGRIPTPAEGERADDSTGQLHLWGAQLERVRAERERALADGDSRRAAELGHRAGRIRGDIERERRRLGGEAASADAQLGRPAQAPGAALRGDASSRGTAADIPAARRELDRELAERSARRRAGAGWPASPDERGPARRPERTSPQREPRGAASGTDAVGGRPSPSAESSVMRDAREVEARRKRQLGLGRD